MNNQNLLQEKGLKTTSARLAILNYLEKQNNPIDVFTIVGQLNKDADQATVYRILEILTQKGIISRLEFGEGKYRYELQKDHHHHLICTNCGQIDDIPGEFLESFDEDVKEKKGFLVKRHTLEFFGLCPACQS